MPNEVVSSDRVPGGQGASAQLNPEGPLLPRWVLAGVAFLAAAVFVVLALIGPVGWGWIRYPTSQSAIWQGQALDLVNAVLMAPLLVFGGLQLIRARDSAKYFLTLPALTLIYSGISYGVGQEWGNPAYSGNSYQFAPLFLALIIAGLLLGLGSLSLYRPEDAPRLSRRSLWIFTAILVPFLLVFALLWVRQVLEVMATGTLSDGTYASAPTAFWLVRYLDLGVTIPLGLLTPYLLLTAPRRAYPIALLFAGYMVTLGTSVVVMAGLLAYHADPSVTGENSAQLVIFPVLGALSWWILFYLVRPKLAEWWNDSGRRVGGGTAA